MRRLTVTLALLAALFALPMVASADDGGGMRTPPTGDYGLNAR